MSISRMTVPMSRKQAGGALGGSGKKATHDVFSFHNESRSGVASRLKRDRHDLALAGDGG